MNKNILIFIILAIIIIGGILFWQFWPREESPPEIDNGKAEPEDSEFLDWKTYHNEDFGVSFDYPAHCELQKSDYLRDYIVRLLDCYIGREFLDLELSFLVWGHLGPETCDNFDDNFCQDMLPENYEVRSSQVVNFQEQKENITVYTLHFIQNEMTPLGLGLGTLEIEASAQELEKIVEQIFSSFEFINKEELPENDVVLEECIQASSWEEYYEKREFSKEIFEIIPETQGWVENPIKTPDSLKISPEKAELYRFPLHPVGGDIVAEPVVVYENNYCKLTENNYAKVFAPIKNNNAIDYLMFAEVVLAKSYYGYFGIGNVILDKKNYDELISSNFIKQYDCSPDFEEIPENERKITEIIGEKNDQYIISLISCSSLMQAGCFESIFLVGQDGLIERGETEEFIKCDMSIMF